MKRPFIFLCAALIASASAQATVIAQYDFTGGSTASSDTELSTTASSFAASGITPSYTSNRVEIGGDDTPTVAFDPSNPSDLDTVMDAAITNGHYLSFTVTIDSATEVDLTSIDFDYTSTSGFDFGFGLFSDKTGFTVGNELAGVFGNEGSDPSLSGPIDLTGITSLQNLTDTTVEFRFYLTDRSGSNTRIHLLDNVSLEGNVGAIPEPSSAFLLGFAFLGILRRRR
ncbi:PEP-CTERM sorting domain-containing protein [Haloferula sp. A504]|uniref:PEP-CTERM sorting domain-containing protein n=1 Tax=Haloferula sp. A504 TaxID=3373601 RepID=UPI0031CB1769|nr:PEP-CTERM sorting domain-containing protein [Verrucomicrobiaceae bacterium E54]